MVCFPIKPRANWNFWFNFNCNWTFSRPLLPCNLWLCKNFSSKNVTQSTSCQEHKTKTFLIKSHMLQISKRLRSLYSVNLSRSFLESHVWFTKTWCIIIAKLFFIFEQKLGSGGINNVQLSFVPVWAELPLCAALNIFWVGK